MSQISKKHLSTKTWKQIWDYFVTMIVQVNKRSKANTILLGLLTETEQVMLSKRLMILGLSMSDVDAYQISRLLKVSISTVYKTQLAFKLIPDLERTLKRLFPDNIALKDKKGLSRKQLINFIDTFPIGYSQTYRKIRSK